MDQKPAEADIYLETNTQESNLPQTSFLRPKYPIPMIRIHRVYGWWSLEFHL